MYFEISSARGFIIKVLNELRLQSDLLPPSEWLANFMKSHDMYTKFLPKLRDITIQQQTKPFPVPSDSFSTSYQVQSNKYILKDPL